VFELIPWHLAGFVQPGCTIEVLAVPPRQFRQLGPPWSIQPASVPTWLAEGDARGSTSSSKFFFCQGIGAAMTDLTWHVRPHWLDDLPKKRESTTKMKKMPQLDAVRGIAVLLVLVHNTDRYPALHLHLISDNGWMGVDLFFVLSGLLITGILLDTKQSDGYFRNFYARRVLAQREMEKRRSPLV
jgi:hypothetical protein